MRTYNTWKHVLLLYPLLTSYFHQDLSEERKLLEAMYLSEGAYYTTNHFHFIMLTDLHLEKICIHIMRDKTVHKARFKGPLRSRTVR